MGQKRLSFQERMAKAKQKNRIAYLRRKEKMKTDSSYAEKINARRRLWYEKNKEKESIRKKQDREKPGFIAKESARNLRWTRLNKEKYRKRWNAWYERVKHTKRGLQLAARIRLRPLYGLKDALAKFESGAIGVDEFVRQYDNALTRVNAFSSNKLKSIKHTTRTGNKNASKKHSRPSQGITQINAPQIGYSEGASQNIQGYQRDGEGQE